MSLSEPYFDANALPAYDVVIPCFNRARAVADAVDSILAQRHRPRRLIVVDDGSSDDTARVLLDLEQREPMVCAVILPRNAGASAARNAGLALAREDWIAFLDSDDVWVPHAADALLGAASGDEADIYVGAFRRAWPNGEIDPPECGWDGSDIRTALRATGAIGPSWTLIRRMTARRVDGFDPSFHNCNDWDFFARAAAAGARFERIEATIALYRYDDRGRLSHDHAISATNALRVQAHPWFAD